MIYCVLGRARGGLPFGIRNVLLHQLVLDNPAGTGHRHGAERNDEQQACNAHEFAAQVRRQHPIEGSPTEEPTTWGIDQIPFHCRRTRKRTMNQQSFPGIGNAMSSAPTALPMKAPHNGIRAVREISTPTSRA